MVSGKQNIYKCWVSTSILVYKRLFSSYVIMFLDFSNFSYGFFFFLMFVQFFLKVFDFQTNSKRRATPQDADSCDCNAPEPAGVARATWTNMELHRPRCVNKCIYWVKVVTYAAVIFLCRKRCAVGKSMIYMSFLLDESIVCGIDFSNTLQGHTCFWDIFFLR